MRRAVFLDRDGVLNHSLVRDGRPFAPRQFAEFRLYEEAFIALSRLKSAGFQLVVVTNQPDIGNGLVEVAEVEAMNGHLARSLPVDEVVVCPHSQTAGCDCRKPKPGMLTAAAARRSIDLTASFMVGDRKGDIEAGRNAGCRTVFIDRRYAEPRPEAPTAVVDSLTAAVDLILTLSRNDASVEESK